MKLEEIKKEIFKMGRKIGLNDESKLYPMFSRTSAVFSEGASIYTENSKYYYVFMERGHINKCYESENLEEILYLLFESITFKLASDYELHHRLEEQDSRRLIWTKQLELLERIDKSFKKRCKAEIEEILKIAPFNDENKYGKRY